MSKWVNVEAFFQRRAMVVEFPAKGFVADATALFYYLSEQNLAAVEIIARKMVVAAFPHLECCEITYVSCECDTHCFLVGVSHPSLPWVPDGEYLPRERVARKELAVAPEAPY